MTATRRIALTLSFISSLVVGLVGCKGEGKSQEPGDDLDNLCTQYTSCNACIEGQEAEGMTRGKAETQCALAVTGCWVTWDKPVVCGDEVYEERPES